MGELINIDHLSYTYKCLEGDILALRDVSFHVMEGEIVAIIGPGDCGKSTLLSLIAGFLTPTGGTISINGVHTLASGKSIGYMLQKDQLPDCHNILKSVNLSPEIQYKLSNHSYVQINEHFNAYGLITFINSHPSGLEEGARQRTTLMRTLLLEPDILLLDEPFIDLDYGTRMKTADDIWNILRKEKKTTLLITHDIAEAVSFSDRIIVLTSHPGTVKQIFDIQLSLMNQTPSIARSAPEFEEYSYQVWNALNHEDFANI